MVPWSRCPLIPGQDQNGVLLLEEVYQALRSVPGKPVAYNIGPTFNELRVALEQTQPPEESKKVEPPPPFRTLILPRCRLWSPKVDLLFGSAQWSAKTGLLLRNVIKVTMKGYMYI